MRTRKAFLGRLGGARQRRSAGAFTLVEIVAAMALAVIIMLGIVQVFKMASEAVTNTESTTDSYQMARGIFTMLRQDLMRFSNEGYLYVLPQRIFNPHGRECTVDRRPAVNCLSRIGRNPGAISGGTIVNAQTDDWFEFDTLIFTAVGRFVEMGLGSKNPQESCFAEIMYSYARRAASGATTSPWSGTAFKNTDPRGVCLVRKAFLGAGEMTGSTSPLGPVTGTRSSFIMMQQENTWSASPKYRISPMRVGSTGYGNMAQIIDADEKAGVDSNVNYVIGERVSEFMVEIWGYSADKYQWLRPPGEPHKKDGSPHFLWSGTRRNPEGKVTYNYTFRNNIPRAKRETYYNYMMPKMLRVTVVVHPHTDKAPLEDHAYCESRRPPETSTYKYRGEVFRRVFRLTGVRGGRMKVPTAD